MALANKMEPKTNDAVKHFIVIVLTSVIPLLWACTSNKNPPTTNIKDSLNPSTSLSVAMDSPRRGPSNDTELKRAADSTAFSKAAKMFGASPESASFTHMKDSMLSMVKSKLGNNAGTVDTVMSALSKPSTSSPGTPGSTNSSISKTSIPFHESLADNYLIPLIGSGSGLYYEYAGGIAFNDRKSGLSFTLSIDPAKTSGWNVYYSGYAQVPQLNVDMHFSFLMNNGFTHVEMNDDHKVYTIQTAEQVIQKKNYSVTDIKVTKIGNETLHGFNCVHARVTAVTHFMGQTQNNEFDVWRSQETPGASCLESSIQVLASPFTLVMENELVKIGCRGAVIKIEFNEKSSLVRKELFKITRRDIDDAIFNIPPDYKEDKNTSLYSLMRGN